MPVTQPSPSPPWWRFPLVWMVIALPAVVIMGSLATAWIAVHSTDTVVEEDYYRKGIEINRSLAGKSLIPAQQGRNHAMTPGKDVPVPTP